MLRSLNIGPKCGAWHTSAIYCLGVCKLSCAVSRSARMKEETMLRYTAVGPSFILMLLSIVAFGAQTRPAAAQVEETTVAGCLQPGSNDGEFVLVADDKQTYQVQPAEGVEIAPHANHRVELTGTVEKNETSSVLKATALKMVASSCEP